MRILTLIATFLICPLIITGKELSLILHTEKSNYLKREPITIVAELKNIGNLNIKLPELRESEIGLNVVLVDLEKDERLYKNFVMSIDHSNSKKIDLLPNESAFLAIPMVPIFYGNTSEGAKFNYYYYVSPGNYSLSLQYILEDEDNISSQINKKVFNSNIVEIHVSEPSEKDDIEILAEYDNLVADFSTGSPLRMTSESILYQKKIIEIIKKHCQSDYGKILYEDLILRAQSENVDNSIKEYLREYIDKYPSSLKILYYFRNEMNIKDVLENSKVREKLKKSGIFNLIEKQNQYIQKIIHNLENKK